MRSPDHWLKRLPEKFKNILVSNLALLTRQTQKGLNRRRKIGQPVRRANSDVAAIAGVDLFALSRRAGAG